MIHPWIFEFANSTPAPGVPLYDWYLDLWQQAEQTGFEGIFFSEHHFHPGAASPSPHLLIAAVAMRTSTLRLGVMGSVLPLHTPWRVAEEIGMLDHLTGGRLEVGYSSGIGPAETTIAGIPIDDVRPRFDEAVDIIEQALTGARFSHQGRFWHFNPMETHPRTFHSLPPRWTTVLSTGSARAAALRGFKICTGFISVPEAKTVFDAYREAAGGPCPDHLALRRQVFIAPSDAEAREIGAKAASDWRAQMSRGRGDRQRAVPDAPSRDDFMFGADEQINGSPATVAELIIEQCRATGAGHLMAFVYGPISRPNIERNYRLWREVIPVLRAAAFE